MLRFRVAECGVNVDTVDNKLHQTPSIDARSNPLFSSLSIIQCLTLGADVNASDIEGLTDRDRAVKAANTPSVEKR